MTISSGIVEKDRVALDGDAASHPAAARSLQTATPGRRWQTVVKLMLLVALLGVHFSARWKYARTMPLENRHNYERVYSYALSLLSGKGFHFLAVPNTPAAQPVARFLDKQSDRVSDAEFAAFLADPGPADFDADMGAPAKWASSRILDQYVIAGLWRLFGIRWSVVFLLGAALSTLTCLAIVLIARRLSGNDWAGLAAGLLFFASPLAGFLETWSFRDASPLWFEALGFWFLLCVVDRARLSSVWRMLAAGAALGFVAMLGIGWRPDTFLLVLYLACGMIVLFRIKRAPTLRIAAAVGAYIAAAWLCHAAVGSLTTEPAVDSENGFHMACYGDFSRANLLEIENSFAIERCDHETLFLARQRESSRHPEAPPLPYIGQRYSHECRSMFFDEAAYNAYALAASFPAVYWQALGGLAVPDAFETHDVADLEASRPAPWRWGFQHLLNPLSEWLPWLFIAGLIAATAFGPARPQAAIVAGITLLQTAALLLVLPEQKHLATMQLPLCVLGGIGLIALLRMLWPGHWRALLPLSRWRPPSMWFATAAILIAAWGASCLVGYELSLHERRGLIAAIHVATEKGVPAPETIHGGHVFSTSILPNSPDDEVGYLLTIHAGANPGRLQCRRIHFPQDWCWPRALETTHVLQPNREQFFFVTCLQGWEFGDPRPYNCSAYLDGDAEITSCRRVDLKHWDRLPVSTVFYDGEDSAGSPRSIPGNSVMRWPNWPAIETFANDWRSLQALGKATIYGGPQSLPKSSAPVHHIIGRDDRTGEWSIAMSNGRSFQPNKLNYWAPRNWSILLSGDFQGDGMTGLLGQFVDGKWWRGAPDGSFIPFKPCEMAPGLDAIDYAGVGDFNGDGIDDVALRSAGDGAWWIGISDGRRFSFSRWGGWQQHVPAENVRVGDFNGDGRADIAGLDPHSGEWIVSASAGQQFQTSVWGRFPAGVAWRHILAADFAGNGRTHVAALDPATGAWQLGHSDGGKFDCQPAGNWPREAELRHVQTGRFGSDRRQSVVALDAESQRLLIATLDGRQFATRELPAHPSLKGGIYVGDFNGAGRDQVAGIDDRNTIWVGGLSDASIDYQSWGTWPDAEHLTDRRVVSFWR